jgi:hypothetical protein
MTVLSQPLGQLCTVTNGSGTATANVTDVEVTCPNAGEWYAAAGRTPPRRVRR